MTDEQNDDRSRAKRRFEELNAKRERRSDARRLQVEKSSPRPIGGGEHTLPVEGDPPTDEDLPADERPPVAPPGEEPPVEEQPPPGEEEPPTTPPEEEPPLLAEDPILRARRIALAITAVWEGSRGYANYQNYDAGVISYGKHQVTLASGNLSIVVNEYLANAAPDSQPAAILRTYAQRITNRDASLRNDETLRDALIAAAEEQVMRDAQDRTIIEGFWGPALRTAAQRGLIHALSRAFLFDSAIQHGPYHPYIGRAEEALGVPEGRPISETSITEEDLIGKTAEERLKAMRNFAARTNLRGVIPRAEFWVELIATGDWGLAGDDKGVIIVNTRPVNTHP